MYYNEIREKITAHAGKECAEFAAKITAATVGDVLASWYLKQYTTPATLAALQELPAGDTIPEEIKNRMQTKRAREAARDAKKRFERVNEVEEVEAPAAVSVVVEWHKSRTWGMNPRARVAAERVATYGSASGCGVSCFYSIFEACGYTFRQVASGKAFDVYEITRAKK